MFRVIDLYGIYNWKLIVLGNKSSKLFTSKKIKNKKYHSFGTVSKSNRTIIEKYQFDTPSTHA